MAQGELPVEKLQSLYRWILVFLAAVAMVAVALMGLSTSLDVIKRWITGWPFGGVMQLNECLMVVLVFLGIPYAQYKRRHIRIAFIISRFSPTKIIILDIFSSLLCLVCIFALGVMTLREAIHSFSILEYRVGDVRLPIYWARAVIPLGCFIFAGQLMIGMWAGVEKLRGNIPKKISDVRAFVDE